MTANERKIPYFIVADSAKFKDVRSLGHLDSSVNKEKSISFHNLESNVLDKITIQYPGLEICDIIHTQIISNMTLEEYFEHENNCEHSGETQ